MMSEKALQYHHFVLVHGVGHGAWCWFKVRPLLEASGHRVTCLDLASAGIHPSDSNSILSFDDYDKPLFDFMSALPHYEQAIGLMKLTNSNYYSLRPAIDVIVEVILVGHSAGGLSVTHALHEFADKIMVAIFISATMLQSGFISQQDVIDGIPELSAFGDVYELQFSLGTDNPPTSVALRKEFQRRILYQSSPEECSTLASMLLRPWPALAITKARFDGGEERANKVRRVFIKTTQDIMVKPEQQDAMIRRWPPNEVLVIHTDHSPFFSTPDQLFKLLLQASNPSNASS